MTAPQLSVYDVGPTTFYAARSDPRVSFCLYVPTAFDDTRAVPVIVVVHATDRTAEAYRDRLSAFAERHGCIVIAPLFPAGLTAPYELESYKLLTPEFRSDLVLLDIVDEVAQRYGVAIDRFLLHGFSGGGHFAHRFLYLHPERLAAVSIGAPGLVTLPDPSRRWWVGTGGMSEDFGRPFDRNAIVRVPIHLVIGSDDTDRDEITITPSNPLWLPGCNDAGFDRRERITTLQAALEGLGATVQSDVIDGVAHDGYPLLPAVERFFEARLRS